MLPAASKHGSGWKTSLPRRALPCPAVPYRLPSLTHACRPPLHGTHAHMLSPSDDCRCRHIAQRQKTYMLCWMSNNAAGCLLFCGRIARGPTRMRPHTMPHANRCRASIAAALPTAAARCAARARNEGTHTRTTQKPHSKSHTTAPLANRPLCNCCCHPTVPQKQLPPKSFGRSARTPPQPRTAAKKTPAHTRLKG